MMDSLPTITRTTVSDCHTPDANDYPTGSMNSFFVKLCDMDAKINAGFNTIILEAKKKYGVLYCIIMYCNVMASDVFRNF